MIKPKKTSWLMRILFLPVAAVVIGIGVVVVMVAYTYPKLPSMDELNNYQPKLPLLVYSEDNVLLGQFGQEHRIFIDIKNTPQLLIDAILSAEDQRFFEHGGIDYMAVIRAALSNLSSGQIQSGAGTITMQVARNFFLTKQKTFNRKFNELLLAYKIENSLDKNQILSLYINQIYLGQRAYGFAEAAITYFNRPLDKLTIAEYAVLAGLPRAPSAFNPIVNPKRARIRTEYVLNKMYKYGYISEKQYQEALSQKVIVNKGKIKDFTDIGGYVAEMARQYLYPVYGDDVYNQGFKVYTTVNSRLQKAAYDALRKGILNYESAHAYRGAESQFNPKNAEALMANDFNRVYDYGDLLAAIVVSATDKQIEVVMRSGENIKFTGNDLNWVRKYINAGDSAMKIQSGSLIRVRKVNNKWQITQLPEVEGALVAIDPNTGAIKALAGGFDFGRNSFNHVMQAKRQPGSSFKPFIYSAALEHNFTTKTIIQDAPICFPGGVAGQNWCPKNDDNKFLGPISFRQALTKSRNTCTIRVLEHITPRYAIDYVTKFGFQKNQFQPYLPMALGANEATPIDMARAYAVFANGGYLIEPYLIAKITDDSGKVLAKTNPININDANPVIDPRNAFIMSSILKDVAKYGTGARAYRELKRSDVAGKTGTTNEAKDVWFDGYTPDLLAVTWVGYDQPRSLGRYFGASLALPIWIDFMRVALATVPERQILMPDGITVESGVNWRGEDEYIYTEELTNEYVAGESDIETLDSLNNAASAPINLGPPSDDEIQD